MGGLRVLALIFSLFRSDAVFKRRLTLCSLGCVAFIGLCTWRALQEHNGYGIELGKINTSAFEPPECPAPEGMPMNFADTFGTGFFWCSPEHPPTFFAESEGNGTVLFPQSQNKGQSNSNKSKSGLENLCI